MPSRTRRRLISAAIWLFLACCSFEVLTGREHWPFSPYPMFSSVEEPTQVVRYRAWGLPVDDRLGRHIELADPDWIAPLHHVRLNSALKKMADAPRPEAAYAASAREILQRYEHRRRQGHHDGPALRGVRLVALTFAVPATATPPRPEQVRTLGLARLDAPAPAPTPTPDPDRNRP